MIRKISYPRAAVIGNPSDGFYGKTIAFPFSNFQAEARLKERDGIVIGTSSRSAFSDIDAFYNDYLLNGISAEDPLPYATIKRFYEYCKLHDIALHTNGFDISFESNIPREVGMAGSSAIITAILKTLLAYYGVSIPKELQANLVMEVETKEMGISAGLQDRVVLAYEQPVYMDFDKALMERDGFGDYQMVAPDLFQNFYIAYSTTESEGSEVVHNDLRGRYDAGEVKLHEAMRQFSLLTGEFLKALHLKDWKAIGSCMNRNFDLRHSICKISKRNIEMIKLARSVGASSKFTGSGGAIIGNYGSDEMYKNLESVFAPKGIQLLKPTIVSQPE